MEGLKDFINMSPLLGFFVIAGWIMLKVMPTWEKLRLREMDVRDHEATTRGAQAASLSELASGIGQMSTVLKDVAIEQRRATEVVEILQRANSDTQDQLVHGVRALIDRIQVTEEKNVHA